MKKQIVIVGGSAGALIASEIFEGQYAKILYLEPYTTHIANEQIIGKKIEEGISFLQDKDTDYFIATGDNQQRKENFDIVFHTTNKQPVNCIHPSAYIAKSVTIGYGNLICPNSVIHTRAVVGNNTIINTSSVIEHDCLIQDYAQISPNATLCGYVTVGEFAFIGAGSTIIPKITIGENSIVAAGSSVIHRIEDDAMYAGVPAVRKKTV